MLWKFGTLPPTLIAFRGHVHGMDPSWHMLGLGYQQNTDIGSVKKAEVIHYNDQCKPWLDIVVIVVSTYRILLQLLILEMCR
jgi:alpha-1,4-galacturonosyltransferase